MPGSASAALHVGPPADPRRQLAERSRLGRGRPVAERAWSGPQVRPSHASIATAGPPPGRRPRRPPRRGVSASASTTGSRARPGARGGPRAESSSAGLVNSPIAIADRGARAPVPRATPEAACTRRTRASPARGGRAGRRPPRPVRRPPMSERPPGSPFRTWGPSAPAAVDDRAPGPAWEHPPWRFLPAPWRRARGRVSRCASRACGPDPRPIGEGGPPSPAPAELARGRRDADPGSSRFLPRPARAVAMAWPDEA